MISSRYNIILKSPLFPVYFDSDVVCCSGFFKQELLSFLELIGFNI